KSGEYAVDGGTDGSRGASWRLRVRRGRDDEHRRECQTGRQLSHGFVRSPPREDEPTTWHLCAEHRKPVVARNIFPVQHGPSSLGRRARVSSRDRGPPATFALPPSRLRRYCGQVALRWPGKAATTTDLAQRTPTQRGTVC